MDLAINNRNPQAKRFRNNYKTYFKKRNMMKEVTLKIPESKLSFFLELIEHLGFEVTEEMQIPEEHKAIVRERIKLSKPDDLILRTEARKQFTFKGKS